MTDVRLYQSDDDGEIDYVNGQAVMSDGLETAAYLSMFGGNFDDSGETKDDARQWWGNLSEQDDSNKYRSATQNLLASLPATTGNLSLVQDAAKRDLAWMAGQVTDGDVEVVASIPTRNTINIAVAGSIDNEPFSFNFGAPWPGANA